MGQRVVVLDPWNEINERYGSQTGEVEQVTRFNPLSALRPDDPNFNDDIVAMADALTLRPADGDNHWTDSARELIAGLIAAAVETNPGTASLRQVRKLVTGSDNELVEEIERITTANADSLAARKLRRFTPRSGSDGQKHVSNEITSIRSTAETQTAFLDSERLLEAMETDDPPFNMDDLGSERVTLYVGLPVDRLQTHGRWLRLILTLAIRTLSRRKKPPELPVVLMLDEFGTISPGSGLAMVEQSFGLMAGLGIRVWAFLQDLPQLQRDYPRSWETFVSNASLIQVLNCADATTSEYFSRYLGTMTVNAKTGGWSYRQVQWKPGEYAARRAAQDKQFRDILRQNHPEQQLRGPAQTAGGPSGVFRTYEEQLMNSLSVNKVKEDREDGITAYYKTEWVPDEALTSRPVLFPHEVRESSEKKSILIFPRRGNYRLDRFTYHSDPVLSARARHDPNKPPPVVKPRSEPPKPTAAAVAAPAPPSSPAPAPAPPPAPAPTPSPGSPEKKGWFGGRK